MSEIQDLFFAEGGPFCRGPKMLKTSNKNQMNKHAGIIRFTHFFWVDQTWCKSMIQIWVISFLGLVLSWHNPWRPVITLQKTHKGPPFQRACSKPPSHPPLAPENGWLEPAASFKGVPSLNPKKMVNWHPLGNRFGTPIFRCVYC